MVSGHKYLVSDFTITTNTMLSPWQELMFFLFHRTLDSVHIQFFVSVLFVHFVLALFVGQTISMHGSCFLLLVASCQILSWLTGAFVQSQKGFLWKFDRTTQLPISNILLLCRMFPLSSAITMKLRFWHPNPIILKQV